MSAQKIGQFVFSVRLFLTSLLAHAWQQRELEDLGGQTVKRCKAKANTTAPSPSAICVRPQIVPNSHYRNAG